MENDPAGPKDFAELERQETSENAPERRIPVACDHNPEGQSAATSDKIAAALMAAASSWRENRDPRSLRRALFDLLRALDA
jgi:hypothetical protein